MTNINADNQNWLEFGDIPTKWIAELESDNPFFLYSRKLIDTRWKELREKLPDKVQIAYSIKANPWNPLVTYMSSHADGLDVTSRSEMMAALNTGIQPKHIMFAGPGKSRKDITGAVVAGVTICVESHREYELIKEIASIYERIVPVLIRVNPKLKMGRTGMHMGGGSTPFGVDTKECPDLLRKLNAPQFAFKGLHFYWGSQCLDAEAILDVHSQIVATMLELKPYFPRNPEILNIGGGFGIPYTEKAASLDLTKIGVGMGAWIKVFKRHFPKTEIVLELGRYLIGEAGLYVCRIVDIKWSGDVKFAVTNGGLHHHLAASGNFGQVIRRNYPMMLINKHGQPLGGDKVNVVGCLCTPLDQLGRDLIFPDIQIGDFIGIFQSGAYAKSASPTEFLGHPTPSEYLL